MKRFRICYFSFTAILWFTALLTGRREFFLLLFMLLFVALYALALNFWTILSFTFIQELTAPSGTKGGLLHLKIRIQNDKPFPFTLMRIQVETVSPSEQTALRFNLSPNESISFEVPLSCAYRGEFAVGMTVIDVTDIFGLFKIRYDLRTLPYYRQRRLKIYPRIIVPAFLPMGTRDSKLTAGGLSRTGNSGESLYGLREYREGDAMRQIHWTASARAGKLIVKTYEIPSQATALIAVDNRTNGLCGEALLQYADLACSCACAIARYCSGKGREVNLISAGAEKTGSKVRETGGFAGIYEALAVMEFNETDSLAGKMRSELKKAGDVSAIYVLTGGQDAELDALLAESARNGCDVKYIMLNVDGVSANPVNPARRASEQVQISYGDDIAAALEGLA